MDEGKGLTMCGAEGKQPTNEGTLYHQLHKTITSPLEARTKSLAREMLDHCFAGYGTASTTLSYMISRLSFCSEYQSRLYAKLSALSSNPNIKDPYQVSLLGAIIRETERLYPSPPAAQPMITPADRCTIGLCTNIQNGVRVGAQVYIPHDNESVFPDAERWWSGRYMTCHS